MSPNDPSIGPSAASLHNTRALRENGRNRAPNPATSAHRNASLCRAAFSAAGLGRIPGPFTLVAATVKRFSAVGGRCRDPLRVSASDSPPAAQRIMCRAPQEAPASDGIPVARMPVRPVDGCGKSEDRNRDEP
jgi:hypothetical protein